MTKTLLNNRYQVIQVLGAGGFGETSLAKDTHLPSQRRCVIKQLKPTVINPNNHKMITQRFEREAATLEILGKGSDQIPELYAYFCEHGEFYLVQEWIQGQTLIDIVESQGCQTESNVREILLSLLSILIYVHSQGIIHRDIKPDNIILRSRDNKPVLIDFGAVKETVRSVASSPHPGSRSMVIGTPGYMPTEQAIGRPVYASDIYSLGLTAVYLLTGKHPSELATHPQTGEILWVDLAPNVSPHLAQVINQSIQPHVSDRYSTASKMLYALKSASDTAQQSSMTTATVHISPKKILSTHQTQAISSLPTIPTSIWQKPVVIIASLLLGSVIGGVAISSLTREQQPEVSLTTSSQPRPFSESTDINPTSLPNSLPKEPADTASTLQPPVESVVPVQSQPQVTARFKLTPETPPPPPQQNQDGAPSNSKISGVPAFPTGTSQQTVKAVLGQPTRTSNGLWNTRAFLYQLDENVDLGYLFDRKTGVLRQTEVSFTQSVDPEIMQTTLKGILGGNFKDDINQKLQKVRDRQSTRQPFNVGELKGVIERNQQDRIYIGVWDADLH
ncbi:serine/threonine-protein kinase [Anabaena sp. CS-542/02]|uniref:serine/threonine-protein kinase n=1 Tax=Anabaena sp. CS-542/02 TaxID=3021719 RepID=UPI00232C89EE|nr:serine/threonine-protein kinase [Anabaena sp. CS-542/02]MDB9445048.1 serine/threonine-protein kinase [Anabaena sp. CS-542/02]